MYYEDYLRWVAEQYARWGEGNVHLTAHHEGLPIFKHAPYSQLAHKDGGFVNG